MKVAAFDLSRHVRILSVARLAGQLYLPNAALLVTSRYAFANPPKSIEELLKEPIVFRHGKFGESAVDEFAIYSDGVMATARSDTDFLEDFLEDFLNWAKGQFDLVEIAGMPSGSFYDSQLVAQSDRSIDTVLQKLTPLSKAIDEKLASYGQKAAPMSPAGFSFDVDSTKLTGRRPLRFVFERRVGAPMDAGLYYSTAPLRTRDHLEILNALEDLL